MSDEPTVFKPCYETVGILRQVIVEQHGVRHDRDSTRKIRQRPRVARLYAVRRDVMAGS